MDTPLVNTKWLFNHLDHPNLVVLDASMKVVTNPNDSTSFSERIPGTRFFNIKENFSDRDAAFPNTFPSKEQFVIEARKLGINKDSWIVVYDDKGIYASPRAWWMFKTMGHKNVAVLNGGLPQWIKDGYPLSPISESTVEYGDFVAKYNAEKIRNKDFVLKAIERDDFLILDARSKGRFDGVEQEPRKGVRSGHIPHSKNLPYSTLQKEGKMLSKDELKQIFSDLNTEKKHLVFSCGSGITACILALGAEIANYPNLSIYDGSWTEWGSSLELPIE